MLHDRLNMFKFVSRCDSCKHSALQLYVLTLAAWANDVFQHAGVVRPAWQGTAGSLPICGPDVYRPRPRHLEWQARHHCNTSHEGSQQVILYEECGVLMDPLVF